MDRPENSWPFKEANKISPRSTAIFAAGFGPSGAPHIGTLGEVMKISFVRQAWTELNPKSSSELIVFADDMDGLRKVPLQLEKSNLKNYIDMPLTSVPDPYGCCNSYGDHNVNQLQKMLDRHQLQYKLVSATKSYQEGKLNDVLLEILHKHDEIAEIVKKFVGSDRAATYSPFLPKNPKTGRIKQYKITKTNPNTGTICFLDELGQEIEIPVTDGNCKLQWKVDWAARWKAFGVTYEMYGKDLIDSKKVGVEICKSLGIQPPEGIFYELYSDENNKKISKSKGNGITIEDWENYGTNEGLTQYMFSNPQSAKKLSYKSIIHSHDEYIKATEEETSLCWFANPIANFYPIRYSTVLALVRICDASDPEQVLSLFKRYKQVPQTNLDYLKSFISKVIAYYKDIDRDNEFCFSFEEKDLAIISKFSEGLKLMSPNDASLEEKVQELVFNLGRDYCPENSSNIFPILYRALVRSDHGPKMGSLVKIYGIQETIIKLEKILIRP